MTDRQQHWQAIYADRDERTVSWYQPVPEISLRLIEQAGLDRDASLIDIGGGASHLVDLLLQHGYRRVTVLDIAEAALAKVRRRLGAAAGQVQWLVADITQWAPTETFDIWHDRAVFHFLTDAGDRSRYLASLNRALPPGGQAIIGTFAPDGPTRCSGLPVRRYDAKALAAELGAAFHLQETARDAHQAPSGRVQHFQFCRFAKRA